MIGAYSPFQIGLSDKVIDGIYETHDGSHVAYQVKYRQNHNLTFADVARYNVCQDWITRKSYATLQAKKTTYLKLIIPATTYDSIDALLNIAVTYPKTTQRCTAKCSIITLHVGSGKTKMETFAFGIQQPHGSRGQCCRTENCP
jgi:hypothetical protein